MAAPRATAWSRHLYRRLTVDDRSSEQPFEVKADPGVEIPADGYDEQQQLVWEAYSAVNQIHESVIKMISVCAQISGLVKATQDHTMAEEIAEEGEAVNKKVTEWIESVIQPRQQTFQDVINFHNKLNAQFLYLYGSINGIVPPLPEGAKQRLEDLQRQWRERKRAMQTILSEDVAAFNNIFEENNIPAVITGE